MLKEYKRITFTENCVGCFACEVACKQEHNLPVGPRWIRVFPDMKEIDGRLRLNYYVTQCTHIGCPPCRLACPAGVEVWRYIAFIAWGKFKVALEVIRETMPFAGILGRVCTHPCETNCERGKVDELLSIRSLHRFVADYELERGREKANPIEKTKEGKVAIIGSGPAGLGCAYDLVRKGYPVTVFEATPKSGGVLRYGIPEYRLPKEVVDNEISFIEELGVEIRTNTPVKNVEDVFNQGYKAIFLATGAGVSQKLGIPGENTEGVIYALDFLKRVNSGEKLKLGNRVAVIGGGSVAIDAARVSLRLGAKEIQLVCLESRELTCRDRMPAQDSEIEEAEEEGVVIHPRLGAKKISSQEGKLTGLETVTCTSVWDMDGNFAPKFAHGPAPTIEVDTVIVAAGQTVDKTALPKGLEYTNQGTLSVNPLTLQTNINGVFAGGDVVDGPSDAVGAVAAGKDAAVSIDRYLRDVDLREGRAIRIKRLHEVPKENPKKRAGASMDEKAAVAEAKRCLNCGVCAERIEEGLQPACVKACPSHCIYFGDIYEITQKLGRDRIL